MVKVVAGSMTTTEVVRALFDAYIAQDRDTPPVHSSGGRKTPHGGRRSRTAHAARVTRHAADGAAPAACETG
jgi:hypothetical protein